MATWAPGTNVVDKNLAPNRRTGKIQGAIIHITLMFDGVDFVSNWNSRSNYPTYHIGQNGKRTGITHPDRRPYTTAHDVDEIAITFEIDVAKKDDPYWTVYWTTINSVVDTLEHHMRQEGYTKAARNIRGVDQAEFFIGGHRQYWEVGCPGDFMWGEGFDYIINELNRRMAGGAPSRPNTNDILEDENMKLNLFKHAGTEDYYAVNISTGDFVKMPKSYADLNVARGTCTPPIEVGMNEIDYFVRLGRDLAISDSLPSQYGKKFADTAAKYHTVVKGDTLYGIANKYSTTVDQLKKLNNGIDPSNFSVDTKIRYK